MIVKTNSNAYKKIKSSSNVIATNTTEIRVNDNYGSPIIGSFFSNVTGKIKLRFSAKRTSSSANYVTYKITTINKGIISQSEDNVPIPFDDLKVTDVETYVEKGHIYNVNAEAKTNTTANHVLVTKIEICGTLDENIKDILCFI